MNSEVMIYLRPKSFTRMSAGWSSRWRGKKAKRHAAKCNFLTYFGRTWLTCHSKASIDWMVAAKRCRGTRERKRYRAKKSSDFYFDHEWRTMRQQDDTMNVRKKTETCACARYNNARNHNKNVRQVSLCIWCVRVCVRTFCRHFIASALERNYRASVFYVWRNKSGVQFQLITFFTLHVGVEIHAHGKPAIQSEWTFFVGFVINWVWSRSWYSVRTRKFSIAEQLKNWKEPLNRTESPDQLTFVCLFSSFSAICN